jgi:branched-chain amino acid transport system substrate-binding protein
MKLRNLSVIGTGMVLVVTAACSTGTPATQGPGASGAGGVAIKIGIELPMTGGEAPNGVPTANGVQLAISQLHVPGYTVTIAQKDDALNGKHDPQTGAANMQALANDPQVLFVVGPYNSNVAQAEIPVSNSAGMMQCSPANTNPGLTKTWGGVDAITLRPTHPDKIAYVRVATTDDLQGAAGADIAANIAHAKNAYVADDAETYGKGIADVFAENFPKLGGTILKHDGIPGTTTDFTSYITTLKGMSNLDYVYYGGVTTGGIGIFRSQMAAQGLSNIPLGGGDGIVDGSVATASSYLSLAGADGDNNSYGTVAGPHDISSDATPSQTDFATAYKAMFNADPGSYSAAAYACTQVFMQALQAAAADGSDLTKLREDVRAYVADPSHSYTTALGKFNFDATGDTSQKIVSYYQFDATAKDWKFVKQRDFSLEPLQ